ncbi:MAG: nucleoside triphosphate pyrophosphatase [Sphingopyxis sp.]
MDLVILASQSVSRRAMLDAAGVTYQAIPAHVDEGALKAALLAEGQGPSNIADALAELKALKVSRANPAALVIGSDSLVSVEGKLFDKPENRVAAADHLAQFSDSEMVLTSAVVVAEAGRIMWRHVDQARLQVRPLSTAFITAYLDGEWPTIAGCVGCFRIEGPGVQLFTHIKGDHYTVLGMPLLPLLELLRARGAMPS